MENHSAGWWNSLSPLGKKVVLSISLIMAVFLIFTTYSMFVSHKEKRLKIPVTMSSQEAINKDSVSDSLKIDIEQAGQVSNFVQKSYEGSKKPVEISKIPASGQKDLMNKLEDMTKNKDTTYLKQLGKTPDRTLLVPFDKDVTEKTGLSAGVYQIHTAPKTLKGPGIGWNPITDGARPTSVMYSYLRNTKGTDKPPNYWGGIIEAGRSDGKNSIGFKIFNLRN